MSQTHLGDCAGASEHASDLGFTDLSPPDVYTPSHDDSEGSRLPAGDIEDLWLQDTIHLDDIKTAAEFVRRLQDASLDDPSLDVLRGTGAALKSSS